VEANISRIDDETTRPHAVLDGLARKRAAKRAAIHHQAQLHRVLVAPVRRLPPEVLSEIFLLCRETKRSDITNIAVVYSLALSNGSSVSFFNGLDRSWCPLFVTTEILV
jgi:hypothetical protein